MPQIPIRVHPSKVHPDAGKLTNASGDSADLHKVTFRCPGCAREHTAVVMPWSPVFAKYHCRFCERTFEVKTRDEAMDSIEEHIREGAFEQSLRKRKSVSVRMAETPFGRAALIDAV